MRQSLAVAALLPLLAMASPGPKAVPDPVITPAAMLQGRQEADETIVGWVNTRGSFRPLFCPSGRTWSETGSYGFCCNTAAVNCEIPTGCVSETLLLMRSSTLTCTSTNANACVADIVYDDFGDGSPVLWAGCDSPRSAVTLYRTEPNVGASTTSGTSTDRTTSPSPASRSSSISAITSDLFPIRTVTPPPPPPSSNKAWIAGAVVGPIVGLALIGGLIFFLLRRKRNKTADPAAAAAAAAAVPGQQPPPGGMSSPDMAQQYGHPGHMSMVGSPPPQYFDPSKGPVHLDPSQQQYAYPPGATSPVVAYPPPQPGQEYKGAYYPQQPGQSPVAGVPVPVPAQGAPPAPGAPGSPHAPGAPQQQAPVELQ